MAVVKGNLWEYNFVRVVVVDASDDYRLMETPLPSEYYPVLREVWLPRYNLWSQFKSPSLVGGYLYDWHEPPTEDRSCWTVGVVESQLKSATFWGWLGSEQSG